MKKIIYWVFGILAGVILLVAVTGFIKFNFLDNNDQILINQNQSIKHEDLIFISYPLTNTEITSPLIVTGEARGSWFFEASFPVVLTNWDGLIIAEGIAQADGDWMTTDFVPFKATLNFTKPDYSDNGFLILKKDNPSGLPEFDNALEIPIKFR
jgi:hypothetical protein